MDTKTRRSAARFAQIAETSSEHSFGPDTAKDLYDEYNTSLGYEGFHNNRILNAPKKRLKSLSFRSPFKKSPARIRKIDLYENIGEYFSNLKNCREYENIEDYHKWREAMRSTPGKRSCSVGHAASAFALPYELNPWSNPQTRRKQTPSLPSRRKQASRPLPRLPPYATRFQPPNLQRHESEEFDSLITEDCNNDLCIL